jgi:hypothetical protein
MPEADLTAIGLARFSVGSLFGHGSRVRSPSIWKDSFAFYRLLPPFIAFLWGQGGTAKGILMTDKKTETNTGNSDGRFGFFRFFSVFRERDPWGGGRPWIRKGRLTSMLAPHQNLDGNLALICAY